jgi:peptidoglycan hydrolase-like protein with peptidoglycan-binding domain
MEIVRALSLGSSGPDVEMLAHQLSSLGYETGTLRDQTLGPDLQKTIQEFQKDFGLKQDGVVGPATLKALTDAVATIVPGSFRPPYDTRNEIARLQNEIHSRVKELSRLVSGAIDLESDLPVRQFTLTENPDGRLSFKLDPGRIPHGDASAPALKPLGGKGAVCYIDPPGICVPCSAVIIIIVIKRAQ